ncbi:hypothetical protein H6P81_010131 [Aristolochia fimbriata]|uniref:Uncharacterized protein n=1 Tax=Aristolochia fimbriata TaxID=158543 RepID=A0AAV7ERA3_ARIFI|nr:hypothetical protein H6P81_010131 [Aristolochia fimbriata]
MRRNKSAAAVNEEPIDVGQGELYAPKHAVRVLNDGDVINRNNIKAVGTSTLKPVLEASKVVAADVRRNLSLIKDKLMDKLAAAPVPAEALDNARHFVESAVRDVANAAQGLTKDALNRIKTHLAEIIPSLSPHLTAKMVEDAEKEAMGARKTGEDEGANQGNPRSKL